MLLYCTHFSDSHHWKKANAQRPATDSQLGPWVTLYCKRTTWAGAPILRRQENGQAQAGNGEQEQRAGFKSSIPLGKAPGWACRSPVHAVISTLSLKHSASGLAWRTKGPPTDFMHHTMLLHSVKSPSRAHIYFLTHNSLPCHPWRKVSSRAGRSPALYTLVAAI